MPLTEVGSQLMPKWRVVESNSNVFSGYITAIIMPVLKAAGNRAPQTIVAMNFLSLYGRPEIIGLTLEGFYYIKVL